MGIFVQHPNFTDTFLAGEPATSREWGCYSSWKINSDPNPREGWSDSWMHRLHSCHYDGSAEHSHTGDSTISRLCSRLASIFRLVDYWRLKESSYCHIFNSSTTAQALLFWRISLIFARFENAFPLAGCLSFRVARHGFRWISCLKYDS